MTRDGFDTLIPTFLGGTTPRVWSLLVTMFGDLAIAPDAYLSGSCVNALTGLIGIKPEATRVALHRLRKEGWIQSRKTGRASHYSLTPHGREETLSASPRVYALRAPDIALRIILESPSGTRMDTVNTVRVAPHVLISPALVPTDSSSWSASLTGGDPVPQWMSDKLCPPDAQTASQRLAQAMAHVSNTELRHLTLLQKTALRITVLHEWRRLILRIPHFPDDVFSKQWHGQKCRTSLEHLFAQLPVPDLHKLEEHAARS